MTEAQAIEVMVEAWASAWAILQPSVTYGLDNETFRSADPLWARVLVRHTTSQQLTQGPKGARRFVRHGNIIVQLFGDIDAGRAPVAALVGSARAALEAQDLGSSGPGSDVVTTLAGATGEVIASKTTEGKWWQQNLTIPFRYYETR